MKNDDPLLLLTALFLSVKTFFKNLCMYNNIFYFIILFFLFFFNSLKDAPKKEETIENKGAFFTGGFLLPPNWLTQLKPWFNHLQLLLALAVKGETMNSVLPLCSFSFDPHIHHPLDDAPILLSCR